MSFDTETANNIAKIKKMLFPLCMLIVYIFGSKFIARNDLVLLLEGEAAHLPAPKTHYTCDILMDKDTSIFCTSSQEIRMIRRGGVVNEKESEMMAVRWKHFTFHGQVPKDQQRHLLPCG